MSKAYHGQDDIRLLRPADHRICPSPDLRYNFLELISTRDLRPRQSNFNPRTQGIRILDEDGNCFLLDPTVCLFKGRRGYLRFDLELEGGLLQQQLKDGGEGFG